MKPRNLIYIHCIHLTLLTFQLVFPFNKSDAKFNLTTKKVSKLINAIYTAKQLLPKIFFAPLKLQRNKRQSNITDKLVFLLTTSHLSKELAKIDELLQNLDTKFKKITDQISQIKPPNFQWIVKHGEDGLSPSGLAYENALIIMAFTSLLLVATLVTIFKQKPKTAITKTRTLFLHT